MNFRPEQSFAFVMSPRLGDSLLSMVVVNNLVRNGYRVKVFSAQIYALRAWFPGFDIEPVPARADAFARLIAYDVVLHAYHADKVLAPDASHSNIVVMDDWPVYRQVKNMVDIQTEICQKHFGLAKVVRDNGLVAPVGLTPRINMSRVIIHPVASDKQKSWLPMRFVKLALWLRTLGFEPEFLLPPEAIAQWKWLGRYGFAPSAYGSLGEVAARIAESGWVIGNDSGIGHLASNLGVPTISLAMRRSIAQRWRPGWAPSRAVLAPSLMPSRYLKEKYWKYLLSTARVMAAFDALRRDCGALRLQGRADAERSDPLADVRHAG